MAFSWQFVKGIREQGWRREQDCTAQKEISRGSEDAFLSFSWVEILEIEKSKRA